MSEVSKKCVKGMRIIELSTSDTGSGFDVKFRKKCVPSFDLRPSKKF